MKKFQKGFSLFEVVIICTILIILFAIVIASVIKSKDAASDSATITEVEQLKIAFGSYKIDNNDFPPANYSNNGIAIGDVIPQLLYANHYMSSPFPSGIVSFYLHKCTGNTSCIAGSQGSMSNNILFSYLPCTPSTVLAAVIFNVKNAVHGGVVYPQALSGLSANDVLCLYSTD